MKSRKIILLLPGMWDYLILKKKEFNMRNYSPFPNGDLSLGCFSSLCFSLYIINNIFKVYLVLLKGRVIEKETKRTGATKTGTNTRMNAGASSRGLTCYWPFLSLVTFKLLGQSSLMSFLHVIPWRQELMCPCCPLQPDTHQFTFIGTCFINKIQYVGAIDNT